MQPKPSIMVQLADFRAWARSGPVESTVSLLDYVGFVCTPDLFFAFAALFWPELVTHDGMRFLASGFSAEVYNQWRDAGKSRRETQRVINHVHVSTLLQEQVVSDEVAVEVAHAIAAIWSRTIGPDGLVAESIGSGLDDAAVTFFEISADADD
jgi:hypothetical protein